MADSHHDSLCIKLYLALCQRGIIQEKMKRYDEEEFQIQKNRLPAVTTLLLIALIILEFISLVPGAGLEPAQP